MDFLKLFRKKKEGARPCRIVFEKENTENTYITLEDGMKPRIDRDDCLTDQEYQALTARWEEMLALAEGRPPFRGGLLPRYPVPYRQILCGGCVLRL